MDPREPGGYLHVTKWSLIVLTVFVLFMLLITWVGNQLGERRSAHVSSAEGSSAGSPSAERTFSSRSA